MLTSFRHILTPPIFADEADKTRVAALLYIIFLGTIGVGVISSLLVLILQPDPLPHLVPMSIWLLLALSGLFFLRHGYVTATGLVFTIFTWLFVTLFAVISGGIHAPVLASYMVVILLAGLIYNTRVGMVFVGLSVAAGIGLLYAELNGSLPPPLLPDNPVMMGIGLIVIFTYVALLVHLATFSTTNALERARRNEMGLQVALETLQITLEAQQQGEANFRALADNASDGITVFVGEGRIVYANQHAVEIGGYSNDEVQQRTVQELIHPAEYEEVMSLYRQWLAGAPVLLPYEMRLVHKLGHNIYVEITVARTVWQGQPATMAIIRDITARKQAEEILQRTEKRYRELFEEAPAMYVITRNQAGTPIIVDCNELFLSTLNYNRAEVISRPLADFYTPASQVEALERGGYQRALTGHFLVEERQLIVRDGSIIETLLRARPEIDPDNQIIGTRAMFVDITERKQLEQKLDEYHHHLEGLVAERTTELARANEQLQQEVTQRKQAEEALRQINEELEQRVEQRTQALHRSEQMFRDLAENIREVFWIQNYDQMLYISPAYEQVWGRSCASLYQNSNLFIESVAPEDRKRVAAAFRAELEQQNLFDQEYRITRPDGTRRWVRARSFPVKKEDRILYTVGLAEDITERKRVEERLAVIYQLGQELTLLRDEPKIIRQVLAMAADILQATITGCGLINELTGALEYHYHVGDSLDINSRSISLTEGQAVDLGRAVIFNKRAIHVPDISQNTNYVPFLGNSAVRAELCVPMRVRDRSLGVLHVASVTPNYFTPADEQLLQTLADQMAVTLENARLYQRLQKGVEELFRLNTENVRLYQAEQERYREAEALRRAALTLTSTIDLGELLGRILMELQVVIPYDSAAVQLLKGNHLEIIAGQGFVEPSDVIGTRIPLQEGFSPDYQVISSLKPVIIPDTTRSSPLTLAPITSATALIRSWLGVPLVFKNRAIGMITLDKHQPDFYTETHSRIAEAYAAQAAIALENAQLYQDLQNQMLAFQATQAQLVQSERMAALGRLMASIAHEINNPLQSILGFLSLLGEELSQQHRQEKIDFYLNIANREIERIASIVHRMREFYRLPLSGAQVVADSSNGFYRIARVEMLAVDLHLILESVLQLANKKLQHGRVGVERNWGDNLPLIQASPDHLKQVFLNLTLNAVDAMQAQGGTLFIGTALDQAQFYGSQPQPAVRIEFRDTGAGIPPEVLARLFEPFLSTKEYGSGLGLFTSYQIITAHQGRITATSQIGQGTTFTILLPVEQPPD